MVIQREILATISQSIASHDLLSWRKYTVCQPHDEVPLYGHKFHSQTHATTIHVMPEFIICKQTAVLNSCYPHPAVFDCIPAFLWIAIMYLWTWTIAFSYLLKCATFVHHVLHWGQTVTVYCVPPQCHNICIQLGSTWQWGLSVKLSSLIKTVYQECGTVNEIARVKAIL